MQYSCCTRTATGTKIPFAAGTNLVLSDTRAGVHAVVCVVEVVNVEYRAVLCFAFVPAVRHLITLLETGGGWCLVGRCCSDVQRRLADTHLSLSLHMSVSLLYPSASLYLYFAVCVFVGVNHLSVPALCLHLYRCLSGTLCIPFSVRSTDNHLPQSPRDRASATRTSAGPPTLCASSPGA